MMMYFQYRLSQRTGSVSLVVLLSISLALLIVLLGTLLWTLRFEQIPEPVFPDPVPLSRQHPAIAMPDGRNLLGMHQPRAIPAEALKEPKKLVALTFDDGPHRQRTPRLLDILAYYDVPATFFVLGDRAKTQTGILLRMQREGHRIGNHTWSHRVRRYPDQEWYRQEIQRTSDMIYAMTGEYPTLFRPPLGIATEALREHIDLPIILWSIDSRDWAIRDAQQIADHIIENVRPGDVILLHDIYDFSVESTEAIIVGLQEKGYEFATVDELFGFSQHAGIAIPGEVYFYKDLLQDAY